MRALSTTGRSRLSCLTVGELLSERQITSRGTRLSPDDSPGGELGLTVSLWPARAQKVQCVQYSNGDCGYEDTYSMPLLQPKKKVADRRLLASEPAPCARGRASPHGQRGSWPSQSDNCRTTSSDFTIWTHCQFIRDDAVIKTNAYLVTLFFLFLLLERPPFDLRFTLHYRRVPPEEIAHALCLLSAIHQRIRRLYNHHLQPTYPRTTLSRDRTCTIHPRELQRDRL